VVISSTRPGVLSSGGPEVTFDTAGLLNTSPTGVLPGATGSFSGGGARSFEIDNLTASNLSLTAPVPETSTWTTMVLGFMGGRLHGLSPQEQVRVSPRMIRAAFRGGFLFVTLE
jgi:hypothetical protein